VKGLLADEQYIDGAEIKIIVERERGKTRVCRMHPSIELFDLISFRLVWALRDNSLP